MRPPGRLSAVGFILLLAACAETSTEGSSVAARIAPPEPAPAVVSEAKKASTESLTVAFVAGGTALSSTAIAQLDGASRLYRDARPEIMIVSGHSDKTGREFDNLLLSARRANVVKTALVDRGVPADRLQIVAIGEAEPLPGVSASRSAVITWR